MNNPIQVEQLFRNLKHIRSGGLAPILHRHNYSNANSLGATTIDSRREDDYHISKPNLTHNKSGAARVRLNDTLSTLNSNYSIPTIERLPISMYE